MIRVILLTLLTAVVMFEWVLYAFVQNTLLLLFAILTTVAWGLAVTSGDSDG